MKVAEDLFTTAASHSLAARQLAEVGGEAAFNGPTSASIFLLIGYALELSLKAAFVHLGGTVEDAQYDVGHKLKRALRRATERGFQPEAPHLHWLIDSLHAAHAKHYFRYLGGPATVQLPELPDALGIMEIHVRQVARLVYPEHFSIGRAAG